MDLDLKGEWVLRNGLRATVMKKENNNPWIGCYIEGDKKYICTWDKEGKCLSDEKFDLMTRRRGEEQWNS